MNIYTTLNYISEPENKYNYIKDVSSEIFAIQDKIKYNQSEALKSYAKKARYKQEWEGVAVVSDGATAIMVFREELEGIELDKSNFISSQINTFLKRKELIKDNIEPSFIIANAKYNGYTGAKKEHDYYCIIADQVFDLKQFEKIYKMLYVSKMEYNNGIYFYRRVDGCGLLMTSKKGIGLVLPINAEPEEIEKNPYCMSYKKYRDTYNQIEKAYLYGEPEQVEKTA